jgi:hypothetical protein
MSNYTNLTLSKFKDRDIANLDLYELTEYETATLMNEVIKLIEMSVQNERQFQRVKFQIMAEFHKYYDKIKDR